MIWIRDLRRYYATSPAVAFVYTDSASALTLAVVKQPVVSNFTLRRGHTVFHYITKSRSICKSSLSINVQGLAQDPNKLELGVKSGEKRTQYDARYSNHRRVKGACLRIQFLSCEPFPVALHYRQTSYYFGSSFFLPSPPPTRHVCPTHQHSKAGKQLSYNLYILYSPPASSSTNRAA